jgi:hypothetical protein
MVTAIRFCLVVFLVLLQLIAPLIHAHKNDNFSVGSSFHLPEFEQVNSLLDNNSAMIAPSFHEGEIVMVSAGVKENQRRFSLDNGLRLFIACTFVLFFAASQEMPRPFVIQTEPVKRRRYFNLASPRAPPYIIC